MQIQNNKEQKIASYRTLLKGLIGLLSQARTQVEIEALKYRIAEVGVKLQLLKG